MATFIVESVRLSLNGLPTLVFLAAIERSPEYCQAEVFIVPPVAAEPLATAFGQLLAIGDGAVDEALAIAVARDVARGELVKLLQAVPEADALASIEFEPVDAIQVRAARCRGSYQLLSGVASRSTMAHDEIRAFVRSVRPARVDVTRL